MASKTEAYIALLSLLNTLMQILHPPRHWLHLNQEQMHRLLNKVRFLVDFLEDEDNFMEIDGLETQMMASTAYSAEDSLESYVLHLNLARSTKTTGSSVDRFIGKVKKMINETVTTSLKGSSSLNPLPAVSSVISTGSFSLHIQKIIEEFDHIISNVMKIKETTFRSSKDLSSSLNPDLPAVSSSLAPNRQSTLVGLDHKVIDVMNMLDEPQPERQILSIVGMGGIGKTTLARHVFCNPYIVYKFDIRAWVTISQEYSMRKIMLDVLCDFENLGYQGKLRINDFAAFTDYELGEHLYKSLYGRTYLIAMDDMWCSEVWDEIRAFFPDNRNRSRIVITTRLSSLAEQLSSRSPFEMEFLDDCQSWKLLCETVFGQEGCPKELVNLGHEISEICRGLPLSIVVIGGLLAKSNKTLEFWEYVAENLNSIVNLSDDENCLKILSLSYNNLPLHLKPCFLQMVFFPDRPVEKMWLIQLWVAEGILKPMGGKSLEEVGHEYLMDLIGRNLILVTTQGTFDEYIMCKIHDLLLHLCLQEARKENFHCVAAKSSLDGPPGIECKRRLYFKHDSPELSHLVVDALRQALQLRSLYVSDAGTTSLGVNLRFLRLLHQEYGGISSEIMQLVNLRLMYYKFKIPNSSTEFTSSLSLFWNLQTLNIENDDTEPILLPSEIWEMPQIRHFECRSTRLPDPPCSRARKHDFYILQNLRTLMGITNFRCTESVIERIPNLNTLWVNYDILDPGLEWSHFYLHNLVHFGKLESLQLDVRNKIPVENLCFPVSLKELFLGGCQLDWIDMPLIAGSLPNLETLKLYAGAFKGPRWFPIEGEFVRLKYLRVSGAGLMEWRADKSHFPILKYLVLAYADKLEEIPMDISEIPMDISEIPMDISEIPTLKTVKLEECNDSIIHSAKQISEQSDDCLQVIVKTRQPRIDLSGLKSDNFRFEIVDGF